MLKKKYGKNFKLKLIRFEVMKKYLLTIVVVFLIQSVWGQTEPIGDWIVSLNAGIEAHDKRNSRQERLLTMPQEKYGTYHAGGLIQRKLVGINRLRIFGGLGFNYEKATMRRTFQHGHFIDGPVLGILLYQNRYTKLSAPTSISCWFAVTDNFYLSALVESNWLVHRRITLSESSWRGFPYYESTIALEDMQCRLGLRYQWQHVIIGFDARAFNFQKVDKILFSSSIEESWEWHNPLRFDLTVGYRW
jgi:hypothetical protein